MASLSIQTQSHPLIYRSVSSVCINKHKTEINQLELLLLQSSSPDPGTHQAWLTTLSPEEGRGDLIQHSPLMAVPYSEAS
jgi:hypothetical protein